MHLWLHTLSLGHEKHPQMQNFSYDHLYRFTYDMLTKIGCPESDAKIATEVLLSADLRGVDSHGVARLSGYVRLWEKGRINATPNVRVTYETPSTAVVDGDSGLGLVVAPFAMKVAIEKAKNVGTGWVSVKNSNHYGIAGYHAMMALEHDMIGISLTNASPLVSPTFSKERLLGTNPISVAIPAKEEPAFVADMATTTAANGKLEILQRKGLDTPTGWVQDKEGNPTTSANGVKDGGALLPLGGDREHGSHKGYALGAIVGGSFLSDLEDFETPIFFLGNLQSPFYFLFTKVAPYFSYSILVIRHVICMVGVWTIASSPTSFLSRAWAMGESMEM